MGNITNPNHPPKKQLPFLTRRNRAIAIIHEAAKKLQKGKITFHEFRKKRTLTQLAYEVGIINGKWGDLHAT